MLMEGIGYVLECYGHCIMNIRNKELRLLLLVSEMLVERGGTGMRLGLGLGKVRECFNGTNFRS